jgi:hypothetical protein
VSIESSLRWVRRHREILANPEIRDRVLVYVAERVRSQGEHVIWTGLRTEDGAPRAAVWADVVWDDGKRTKDPRFDPRLITWAEAGLPFDDSVVILPTCGLQLCLKHLAAVPWTELGP